MKLNIDANVIKSPLNKDFLIADRIQLETDNLSIMLNAMDINIPINNIADPQKTFKYEGAEKQGNWASYWVNVKAKDLIELYPHVHAHQPGMVSNQTPYDFQFTIGSGIQNTPVSERVWPTDPEKRYVELQGIEAGSEELAVRQILSIVAGQLLTSHRHDAHLINMVGVHIAEQLIHAGMTHFKSGDIKLNGFLLCHGGPVQTERLWRLGNPGTGELTLKHTLLSQQTGPHSRVTNLIPADHHQIYRIDGKYEQQSSYNAMGGAMNGNPWHPGESAIQALVKQQQQQYGGMPNYQHMQTAMQFGGGVSPDFPQAANVMQQLVGHAREAFAKGDDPVTDMNNALYNGMGFHQNGAAEHLAAVSQFRGTKGDINPALINAMSNDGAMSHSFLDQLGDVRNRSLDENDLGPRNEDTPIRGQVMYIEVAPVRVTEEEASIVTDGSQNAYGVYRREAQGDINVAVHVGDFLLPDDAVEYGNKLGRLFGVPTEDYVSPAPADAAE